jgi:hypothetical protein
MMIKRWGLGLLSALGLLLSFAQDSEAFLFHHCCGCHHCDMHICCRQYNAFTPVCFGNVNCIGCCPPTCGFPGCGCGMPGPIGAALGPMGCDPQMAMAMQMQPGMPMMPGGMSMPVSMPMQPMMPQGMPQGTPMPMPGVAPAPGNVPPVLNHTAQYGNPMYYGYGVQPAGYGYPGYFGAYPYTAVPYYGNYGQRPY